MLLALVGLILSLTVTTEINCGALYTFNSWTGNMSILCASTSLMLRTVALWERRRVIVVPLGILCVVHWTLLYRTMFVVTANWNVNAGGCDVIVTNPSLLNITFFFTMGFDLVILTFTAVALLKKHSARTDLWKLLFHDGLVYFLITFSTNSIPAVLNVINLNTPMNVIATIPAATVTSIAACRAVIRLLEFNSGEVYVHSISAIASSTPARHSMAPYILPKSQKHIPTRPEVHVTTEHITMAEFPSPSTSSPFSKTSRKMSSIDDMQSVRGLEPQAEGDEKRHIEFSVV